MGLKKKDVIIRGSSTLSPSEAISAVHNYINGIQNNSQNKNGDGSFKDYYFADSFDARDKSLHRIFADACETKYNMIPVNGMIVYNLIDIPAGGSGSSLIIE